MLLIDVLTTKPKQNTRILLEAIDMSVTLIVLMVTRVNTCPNSQNYTHGVQFLYTDYYFNKAGENYCFKR